MQDVAISANAVRYFTAIPRPRSNNILGQELSWTVADLSHPTDLAHRVLRRGCIGRIYETRTGPADLRWFWALYAPSKPATLRTENRTATLEQAKAKFEASWKQWKAWAGMEEVG